MKKWRLIVLLLMPQTLNAQIITAYASGSSIYCSEQIAFDKYWNLYIPSGLGNYVLKIDSAGVITRFAGTGTAGYSGDNGLATSAELYNPEGITTDTFGNVYIAEEANNRIRKVNAITGIISTIAGTGYGAPSSGGYSGDGGPATAAELFLPNGLYFDKKGNLYVADDGNFRVRKIDTSGIITTIVGNGIMGSTGDGGPATSAECGVFSSMCMDVYNNLYVIDAANNTIRKIDTLGIISTIAGDSTGAYSYSGDGVPALGTNINPLDIVFDENGELLISDESNNRVRRVDNSGIIYTIAGDGIAGNNGDGGIADSAEIDYPTGIALDYCGNLYIAQVNYSSVRKVSFNPYCWPEKVSNVITQDISVYPNPAYDEVNIDNVQTGTNYTLFNVNGIIEQKGILKTGKNDIAIPSLPPGMFFLELTDEQGIKTIKKIVKE